MVFSPHNYYKDLLAVSIKYHYIRKSLEIVCWQRETAREGGRERERYYDSLKTYCSILNILITNTHTHTHTHIHTHTPPLIQCSDNKLAAPNPSSLIWFSRRGISGIWGVVRKEEVQRHYLPPTDIRHLQQIKTDDSQQITTRKSPPLCHKTPEQEEKEEAEV